MQVLRRPHLVLADVGRHDGVAPVQRGLQPADQRLRRDDVRRVVERQGSLRAPLLDRRPPRRQARDVRFHRSQRLQQRLQEHLAVPHERHVRPHDLVDGGRVDVDVDELRGGAEQIGTTRDAIVEARADADHEVGLMHGQVRLQRAVHAQHAQPMRVGRRERAQPHQRQRTQHARVPRQLGECRTGARARVDEAAAAVKHRSTRLLDEPGSALQRLHGQPRAWCRTSTRAHPPWPVGADGLQLHILGHVDQDGPGTIAARDGEALAQRLLEIRGVAHLGVPLGHRQRDAQRVALLEGVRADGRRRHLAGDADDGCRVAQRVEQAGRRVAHAGPGRDEHDAGAPRAARIALGRMHGRLLVADEDVPQSRPVDERVVQRQHGTPGVTKDRIDAEFDQGVDQHLRAIPARCRGSGARRGQ